MQDRLDPGSGSASILPFPQRQSAHGRTQRIHVLLDGGAIGVNYQPQMHLEDGSVVGLEALLRVEHSDHRFVNTQQLIANAERSGLIGELGREVMRKACVEFAAMRASGYQSGKLAINMSPLELRQRDFAIRFVETVKTTRLRFSDLELEITESWPLDDPSLDLDQLKLLADLGVTLTLDDFGSGHAKWANLLKLPITKLKIDRSLVSIIAHSKRAHAVVKNTCHACSDLGLDVIAEGICTSTQVDLLLEMGCYIGQGFGLGLPGSVREAVAMKPQILRRKAASEAL